MPHKRKTYREKLMDDKDFPRVEKLTGRVAQQWGAEGTIVIPRPREVDEIMRKVPPGELITINEIRERLAKKHRATIACPICTGIFASVAAHAAIEDQADGRRDITPYWRTLKASGVINEKYPGGVEGQKKLLEKEGHKVVQRGKKYIVADFEKHLAEE